MIFGKKNPAANNAMGERDFAAPVNELPAEYAKCADVDLAKEGNPDLTELVLIIDRSGSMGGLETDTIGGINAVIAKNKKAGGECVVSTILFDNRTEVLHDRVNLADVAPLTEEDYQVRGCTALLDAVGGAIVHTRRVQGYMPVGHKAGHVIFVITTDGFENASRRYSYAQVKKMITLQQELGWEFMFLGANIDAAAEAVNLGIAADRAVEYVGDSMGTQVMYDSVAAASCAMRSAPASAGRIDGSWRDNIFRDKAARG